MKSIIVFLFLLSSSTLFSQVYSATEDEIESFFTTTTCMVTNNLMLPGSELFLKKCMKDYWTLTPYKFITFDEFNALCKDPSLTFIQVAAVIRQDNQEEQPINLKILDFTIGGECKRIEEMPDLGSFPLCYNKARHPYLYKVPVFLQFMQKNIKLLREEPKLVNTKKLIKHYNSNASKLRDLELWILPEQLPRNTSAAMIKHYYPNTVRIVSHQELKFAIEKQLRYVAFIHKVGPQGTAGSGAKCIKYILTTTGDLLYVSQHIIDKEKLDYFLPSDFKNISK